MSEHLTRPIVITAAKTGDWQREVSTFDLRVVRLSNLETGWSYSVHRNDAGALTVFQASRTEKRVAIPQERTGEHDRLLGERCDVWRGEPQANQTVTRRCITADGIELWRRTTISNGKTSEHLRAISLERRSLPDAEMRPPDEAFDLIGWLKRSAEALGHPDSENLNYAVHWEEQLPPSIQSPQGPPGRDCPASEDVRAAGGWLRTERTEACVTSVVYETGRATVRSVVNADGVIVGVSISLGTPYPLRRPRPNDPRMSLEQPPRQETVLGETCRWFSGPLAHDAAFSECQAEDGIALIRSSGGHFSGPSRLLATSVRRGTVDISETAPPADLLAAAR